jgi:hypothetical protein
MVLSSTATTLSNAFASPWTFVTARAPISTSLSYAHNPPQTHPASVPSPHLTPPTPNLHDFLHPHTTPLLPPPPKRDSLALALLRLRALPISPPSHLHSNHLLSKFTLLPPRHHKSALKLLLLLLHQFLLLSDESSMFPLHRVNKHTMLCLSLVHMPHLRAQG